MEINFRKPSVTQINNHIWLLNDNNESTIYVVCGEKYAAVIDTSTGLVNVKEEAQKITSLPLICINTHGHFDHVGGNWSFDKAYINFKDLKLADEYISSEMIREIAEKHGLEYPEFLPIEDEKIFDLGNLELQAYYHPGHTAGEIVLLDRKDRILFSGDGVIEQIWLQMPESLPIDVQIESMKKIKKFRNEFDWILCGHSRELQDAELFDTLLKALEDLKAGNTKNDIDYKWYGGLCRAHVYGKEPRKIAYNKI